MIPRIGEEDKSSSSPTEFPQEAKVKKKAELSSPTEFPQEAKVKKKAELSLPIVEARVIEVGLWITLFDIQLHCYKIKQST